MDKRFLITLFALYALFSPRLGSAKEAGPVERGEALFRELGCLACHKVKGEGGPVGPELMGIYGKVIELATGEKVEVTEEYLLQSILDPDAKIVKGFAPGVMPKAYAGVPKDDLNHLVAFIKSLPVSEEAKPLTALVPQAPPTIWVWLFIGFLGGALASLGIACMARRLSFGWMAAICLIVLAGLAGGVLWAKLPLKDSEKVFRVTARQFAYDPPILRVSKGDRVTITAESRDVLHGFYIDGYNIDQTLRPGTPVQFTFVANKEGKFGLRCSQTCGVLHPFMIGTLIVEPNYLFPGSIGLALGLAVGTLIYIAKRREEE
jgi:cytochrome c2/plastocyanin